MSLEQTSLIKLKGVGKQLLSRLNQIGLSTVADLLFYLPVKYLDHSRIWDIHLLRPGMEVLTQGQVISSQISYGKKRMFICNIQGQYGQLLSLRFFHFYPAQMQSLQKGVLLRCFGKVSQNGSRLEMIHPQYQQIPSWQHPVAEHYLPVYPQQQHLGSRLLIKLIAQCLKLLKQQPLQDLLPEHICQQFQFPPINDAIHYLHRPDVEIAVAQLNEFQQLAVQRLALEELLAHQLALKYQKQTEQVCAAFVLQKARVEPQIDAFIKSLGFTLTQAQQKVIGQIQHDLQQQKPMHRLIQGDVGSGKTIVAAIAAYCALLSQQQVAIMAPTEILAQQLFAHFQHWFADKPVHIALLEGNLSKHKKQQLQQQIAHGEYDLIIGTHALFQQQVQFQRLGLVIIDEQHRFGVHQRLALRNKADKQHYPHLLVMTATPIPRTLAMTAYADLDCSIIDKLPPGRKPVKTLLISQQRRNEVIERIYHACRQGRQCYWICTLVETSETLQCQAAETVYKQLLHQLDGIRIAMVHGRMKNDEKQRIMEHFKAARVDLLIATTVVEVGVDVPNASLMIIENAERLGLSQLHQLRGRIGRGNQHSICILMYSQQISKAGKKRLKIMRETHDGFKIAEEDLKIRGPGEILGTRQSGFAQMKIADLTRHPHLLPIAHHLAQWIVQHQPHKIPALLRRWVHTGKNYKDI